MNVGEPMITFGDYHVNLGPAPQFMDASQPVEEAPVPRTDALLLEILVELRTIRQHLTRAPWWVRLWRKICGIL